MSDFDDFMNSQELKDLIEKLNAKKKKYYWNDSIQSQDKNNNINFERRKFNPSVIIVNGTKRIGINKNRARLTSDDDFNQAHFQSYISELP
jgi:hypothetical protein